MPFPSITDVRQAPMSTDLISLRWAAKKHHKESWAVMHDIAINAADLALGNQGQAVAAMLNAWLAYADLHARRFESTIGDDGVLGEGWADIGRGLRCLLNGETGKLDAGTCASAITKALESNGFASC